MDFHAAMETFAEAWVAANVHTAVNTEAGQVHKQIMEDSLSLVSKDQSKIKTPHHVNHQAKSQPTSPTTGAKSLPIHCVVEQTGGPVTFEDDGSSHFTVELDSYAILPCTTLFSELVRAALVKLGYNSTESMNAKGAIQIKNWRPLSFETISNNANSTIEDILGELTQVAKLRIRLCSLPGITSPETWNDHTVRCAVLSLLKDMGQSTLAKLCPLTQSAISNIANWKYNNKLSEEKCTEFGKWYAEYMSNTTDFPCDTGYPPKDSRLTFHPDHEIPNMRRWYKTCKNPTDEKLKFFAEELNKGHVRQERPKVNVAKLKMWWKNERQREKRLQSTTTASTAISNSSDEIKLPKRRRQQQSTVIQQPSQTIPETLSQSRDCCSDPIEHTPQSRDRFADPFGTIQQTHQESNSDSFETGNLTYVTLQPTNERSLNMNRMFQVPITSMTSQLSPTFESK